MTLTRRQKVLLGGATLAAVAWGLDHWFVPAPAAASAQKSADVGAAPGASALMEDGFSLPQPATPVSEVQRSAADVFDLQRLALRLDQPVPTEGGSVTRLSAPTFAAQNALRATILGPEPIALVGQRKMRIGDKLGGYVLKEILADAAVFETENGERAVLQVLRSRK